MTLQCIDVNDNEINVDGDKDSNIVVDDDMDVDGDIKGFNDIDLDDDDIKVWERSFLVTHAEGFVSKGELQLVS